MCLGIGSTARELLEREVARVHRAGRIDDHHRLAPDLGARRHLHVKAPFDPERPQRTACPDGQTHRCQDHMHPHEKPCQGIGGALATIDSTGDFARHHPT